MPDQSSEMASLKASRDQNPGPAQLYATKDSPVFTGPLRHNGSTLGFYGVTPVTRAAAIAAPTAASGAYVQAQITSMVTAINDLRTALKNVGITS